MSEKTLRAELAPEQVAVDATLCCQNGNRLPCGKLCVRADIISVLMMFSGCSPITCKERACYCSRFRSHEGAKQWEAIDEEKGEVKDCYEIPGNEHERMEAWDMAVSDAILEEGGALFKCGTDDDRRAQYEIHHDKAIKMFEDWDEKHPEFGMEHADEYEVYRKKYRK